MALNTGDTLIKQASSGNPAHKDLAILMVRNSTGLRLWLECSIPGGSQTANSGGAKKTLPGNIQRDHPRF
ncbi:Uncharacterised protein [Serratia fonticola]|uniref:Uncharacterized protein n=1 Tax=Serratia fonticola TaxID=47917 RepID=A0A4U9VXM7_SERFO|nr:Uncharacterised protein [Serratia fonticola]